MTKKQSHIGIFLSLMVLFSLFLRTIHSYEHYFEASQHKCSHPKSENKAEISHVHHAFEKCCICDFNFGSFTPISIYTFKQLVPEFCTRSFLSSFQKEISFFKGALFALRAPPLSYNFSV